MKALQCHLVTLLALLYIWTGTVLWHTHDHWHHDSSCAAHHSHDGHAQHHDEEHCSICFFIHNGTAEVPHAQTDVAVFEKPLFISWNDQTDVKYKHLYIHFSPNKDPPFFV